MAEASPSTAGSRAAFRVAEVLREIARGGLAGVLASAVVGGVGGRLVMRAAALMNPGSTGLRTENGELVGAITANGTLALIFFGGLLTGLVVGVVWVVVAPWIPGAAWRRWLLAMPVTVAIGGFLLVDSTNSDFFILKADLPILAMLLGLVALIGGGVAWLDEQLERRLPRPGPRPMVQVVGYGIVGLLGLLGLQVALNIYLTSEGCGCPNPPVQTGWALIAAGAATAAWWASRVVTGRSDRPAALLAAGRIAVVAAVVAGLAHLAPEIAAIASRA
jgi:hypothetical protein